MRASTIDRRTVNHHKIAFPLVRDADGYPPFDVEDVWAVTANGPNQFVVDNIPFFTRDATIGDTVLAVERDGRLVFKRVVARSTHSLMRVIVFDMANFQEIRVRLKALGCPTEGFDARSIMAVDIPGEMDIEAVRTYLRGLVQDGIAEYEAAIIRHG